MNDIIGFRARVSITRPADPGRRPESTPAPSRGGSGIRLKRKRRRVRFSATDRLKARGWTHDPSAVPGGVRGVVAAQPRDEGVPRLVQREREEKDDVPDSKFANLLRSVHAAFYPARRGKLTSSLPWSFRGGSHRPPGSGRPPRGYKYEGKPPKPTARSGQFRLP